MSRIVPVRRISAAGFLEFGSVLECPENGVRQDNALEITNRRPSARINFALIRATPRPSTFAVSCLERHPMSTQTFVPLDSPDYIAIVCRSDQRGDPDMKSLKAFRCRATQVVHYGVGVWHVGMGTIGSPGVFAMLIHENGTETDCEFREVEPFKVAVDID